MPHEQITITTRDGECPSHVFTAQAGAKAPAIILYMDAAGMRPALIGMAERLSAAGYVVLLPDLFYNASAAEHGWHKMLSFFNRTLGQLPPTLT